MSRSAVPKKKRCKDCPPDGPLRPAPFPGPRCATHNRAVKKRRAEEAHEKRAKQVYGLEDGEYDLLYEMQGGKCAGCQRATGKSKKLSIDHDHSCCPGPVSCGKCVRGLLCTQCNKGVLGHSRDSIEFFERFIDYLKNPPASRLPSRKGERNG